MRPDRDHPHEPREPPWLPGERVRLTRPDNPAHPARGRVGVVTGARWFAPVHRTRGLEAPSELLCTSAWLLWVRFGDEGDDRHPFGLFGREVDRLDRA